MVTKEVKSSFPILKKLARELRYHCLDLLIGTRVEVYRWETIDDDICIALGEEVPKNSEYREVSNKAAIIKYGIIEIEYLSETTWKTRLLFDM